MEPVREFSWSWSRHRCFNSCKKAYSLRYSTAWKGWDRFSDEQARLAYSLKNLRTVDAWTVNVFRDSVRKTLMDVHSGRTHFNATSMKRNAVRRLKQDMNSIPSSSMDPGKFNLDEIFYGNGNHDEIFDRALEKVFMDISCFFRSRISEIAAKLPYSSFKDLKNPISFFIGELKVWVSPDLVFTDEDGLNLVGFFRGDDLLDGEWPSVMGMNVIYACRRFSVPEERIIPMNVFTGNAFPDSLCAYSYRNTGELLGIIGQSSREMREFEARAAEEHATSTDKCGNCEFRRFCHG